MKYLSLISVIFLYLNLSFSLSNAQDCATITNLNFPLSEGTNALVFGNASIEEMVLNEPITLIITATVNARIRSAPTTNATVIGSLSPGESARVDGRLTDNTWLRILQTDGSHAWISSEVVSINGNITSLVAVDFSQAETASLEWLLLPSECAINGLLMQTSNLSQNLMINGLSIEIYPTSTLWLSNTGEELLLVGIEGRTRIELNLRRQPIIAGASMFISLDEQLVTTLPSVAAPYISPSSPLPIASLNRPIDMPQIPTQAEIDEAMAPLGLLYSDDFYASYQCLDFYSVSLSWRMGTSTASSRQEFSGCKANNAALFIQVPLQASYHFENRGGGIITLGGGIHQTSVYDDDFTPVNGFAFSLNSLNILMPTDGRNFVVGGTEVLNEADLPSWYLSPSEPETISIAGQNVLALKYTGTQRISGPVSQEDHTYTAYYDATTGLLLRIEALETTVWCDCAANLPQAPYTRFRLVWELVETNLFSN